MKSKARLALLVVTTVLVGSLPVVQAFRLSQHSAEMAKKAAPAPEVLVASR